MREKVTKKKALKEEEKPTKRKVLHEMGHQVRDALKRAEDSAESAQEAVKELEVAGSEIAVAIEFIEKADDDDADSGTDEETDA